MAFYSLESLTNAYLREHPDWSHATAQAAAVRLRRELHRLDRTWYNSEKRYRDHTTRGGHSPDLFGC